MESWQWHHIDGAATENSAAVAALLASLRLASLHRIGVSNPMQVWFPVS